MARFMTVILLASGVFVAALPASKPTAGSISRPSPTGSLPVHSHSSQEHPSGTFSKPLPSFTGSFTGPPPSGTASHEAPSLSVTKREVASSEPPHSFTGSLTGHPSHSGTPPSHSGGPPSGSLTETRPSLTGSLTGVAPSHTRVPPSSETLTKRDASTTILPLSESFTGRPSHSGGPPSGHPSGSFSGVPPSGTPPPRPSGSYTLTKREASTEKVNPGGPVSTVVVSSHVPSATHTEVSHSHSGGPSHSVPIPSSTLLTITHSSRSASHAPPPSGTFTGVKPTVTVSA